MTAILSVETALPEHRCSMADIEKAGESWLAPDSPDYALFLRFLRSSQTQTRHFVVPLEQMLQLPGEEARTALFREFAPALANQAVSQALAAAGHPAENVDTFVFTSCSCPAIPSVDTCVVEAQGFPRTVRRLPVYQHGCAGGVIGLQLAHRFAKGGERVVLSSTELCSLVFRANNHGGASLVGSALFADGAAAAVVTPADHGLVIQATQSYLLPNSGHLMGYDIHDDGPHLKLDKELPGALAEAVPGIVEAFLAKHELRRSDIDWWLFHPGGAKILDALEARLELESETCWFGRETLRRVGNLSSATILFVLRAFLDEAKHAAGDRALIVGIGPGMTVELILLQQVGDPQ
ncbi:MAG: hypothetical protein KDD44_03170 [Bdellovibrionales bacterium]|nr:hypothetical protein [Bdellovibrionales bacterium]